MGVDLTLQSLMNFKGHCLSWRAQVAGRLSRLLMLIGRLPAFRASQILAVSTKRVNIEFGVKGSLTSIRKLGVTPTKTSPMLGYEGRQASLHSTAGSETNRTGLAECKAVVVRVKPLSCRGLRAMRREVYRTQH